MAGIDKVKVLVLGDSGNILPSYSTVTTIGMGRNSDLIFLLHSMKPVFPIIGVGKSSLTHLIAQKVPVSKSTWTVGCSVEVKLHEYKEGTPQQKTYFIELWDVGGSSSHRNARHVFYLGVHGITDSLLMSSSRMKRIPNCFSQFFRYNFGSRFN